MLYENEIEADRLEAQAEKAKAKAMPKPKAFIIEREMHTGRIYLDRNVAVQAAQAKARLYPNEKIYVSELKEHYTYEEPKKNGKIKRGYYKPEQPKIIKEDTND